MRTPQLGHPTTVNKILSLSRIQPPESLLAQYRQTLPGAPHASDPLIRQAPSVVLGVAGGSHTASFILICFMIGHSFVDCYTACFYPWKATHCPECGPNPPTVTHIIQRCPCYTRAQATYLALIALNLSVYYSARKETP